MRTSRARPARSRSVHLSGCSSRWRRSFDPAARAWLAPRHNSARGGSLHTTLSPYWQTSLARYRSVRPMPAPRSFHTLPGSPSSLLSRCRAPLPLEPWIPDAGRASAPPTDLIWPVHRRGRIRRSDRDLPACRAVRRPARCPGPLARDLGIRHRAFSNTPSSCAPMTAEVSSRNSDLPRIRESIRGSEVESSPTRADPYTAHGHDGLCT